ncbi:MAG TPA: diacylglycerol kinase [Candidatus Goldiibacteriota bacterium]|nr:diacylglycerol kinase [Candidatus Goldiibacteriota bacterium]
MDRIIDALLRVKNALIYAVKGIGYGFYSRKNMTVFLTVAVLVAVLLTWLGTSKIKFTIILASWLLVIIMEITNSAIEKIIDTLHPSYSEGIGHAKDMMAGAVFIALLAAIIVTLLMIWDPLVYKLFKVSSDIQSLR